MQPFLGLPNPGLCSISRNIFKPKPRILSLTADSWYSHQTRANRKTGSFGFWFQSKMERCPKRPTSGDILTRSTRGLSCTLETTIKDLIQSLKALSATLAGLQKTTRDMSFHGNGSLCRASNNVCTLKLCCSYRKFVQENFVRTESWI